MFPVGVITVLYSQPIPLELYLIHIYDQNFGFYYKLNINKRDIKFSISAINPLHLTRCQFSKKLTFHSCYTNLCFEHNTLFINEAIEIIIVCSMSLILVYDLGSTK